LLFASAGFRERAFVLLMRGEPPMLSKTATFAAALALINLGQLGWGQSDESSAITGTVAYLERSALPPDAVVEVQLQDVSAQDAPATIVADVKIPAEGKEVPIAFRIPYASAHIDPTHSYVVRAIIMSGGSRMFTSTTAYPVITRGAPTEVAIMVQPVSANPAPESSRSTTAKLIGTEWKSIELGGNPVAASPGLSAASLMLSVDENRRSGFLAVVCNPLVGSYTLRQRSLHFTPAGFTRMACPEPLMKQEQAFIEALKTTTSYRIVGDSLELRDGKRVLARFKAPADSSASANPTTTPAAAGNPTDKWLGQWNGPEGTFLLLSKNGDKYAVKIQSLDGPATYEGVPAGDRIHFTRGGKTESIVAGSGQQTGMKWLLGKKNCLIIKTGEGFCRD
jgi:putative lipoprotein